MPTLKEHAERTRRLFGDSAEEIHKWIDEYAGKVAHHRRFRHGFDNSTLTELELLFSNEHPHYKEILADHIYLDMWTPSFFNPAKKGFRGVIKDFINEKEYHVGVYFMGVKETREPHVYKCQKCNSNEEVICYVLFEERNEKAFFTSCPTCTASLAKNMENSDGLPVYLRLHAHPQHEQFIESLIAAKNGTVAREMINAIGHYIGFSLRVISPSCSEGQAICQEK